MNIALSSILIFADQDYPFIREYIKAEQAVPVRQPSELIEAVKGHSYPLIIFDSAHSSFSESLVLRTYRRLPEAEYWMITPGGNYSLPDYIVSESFSPAIKESDFTERVRKALRVRGLLDEYGMIGKSDNLKRSAEMIAQIAPTEISTLIIGPSGSGKELVARALHNNSSRAGKTFTAINCGALTESLLESELFGHEKGSFTGAVGRREGIFKRTDGGTVFLDEIGETSPAVQVKLLRVLEQGTFYRVGGNDLVKADVRIVAATNRDLSEAIAEKHFREDLYFRLGAMRINMAGLADRKDDIMPLINHFFMQETGKRRGISPRAMDLLINYGWPGNVRQLRNFVNRMVIISGQGEISETMVTQFIEEQGYVERTLPVVTGKTPREAEFQLIYQALLSLGQEVRMLRELILDNLPQHGENFENGIGGIVEAARTMEDVEEEMIRRTLEETGGNRREAARKLGIGERTLYRKLKKYGVA